MKEENKKEKVQSEATQKKRSGYNKRKSYPQKGVKETETSVTAIEVKKEEKTNNGVGFVERKQNNNYNIVYRNKPNKPKTVSELFGIKKEEPKAEKIEKVEKVEKAEQGENNQKMQNFPLIIYFP